MSQKQFENNVVKSFYLAKRDIYNLSQNVEFLKREISALKSRNLELTQSVSSLRVDVARMRHTKVSRRTVSTRQKFIASKAGTKVHTTKCAFAKSIKPKNQRKFASKNAALNEGYKKCTCVA